MAGCREHGNELEIKEIYCRSRHILYSYVIYYILQGVFVPA